MQTPHQKYNLIRATFNRVNPPPLIIQLLLYLMVLGLGIDFLLCSKNTYTKHVYTEIWHYRWLPQTLIQLVANSNTRRESPLNTGVGSR